MNNYVYIYIYTHIVVHMHQLYSLVYIYIYTQGSKIEIQTQAHWNLIDRSMSALPYVLSPSSILPPPSSHRVLICARKHFARFTNVTFSVLFFFKNCVSLKLRNLKVRQIVECLYRLGIHNPHQTA